MPEWRAYWKNTEYRQLLWLMAVYVLVCFALAWRKCSVFGTDNGEIAYFHNMFWWTAKGRPFYCSGAGYTNFGLHAAFLWALFVPFYLLVPTLPTLFFLQSLMIGLTAMPIYLIARHLFQEHKIALILALAFLLFPPIVSQHVNQLEEPPLAAVFLLFTFYFYLRQDFKLFMLLAFVSCLGRENLPFAIAMFGLYSLIQRRGLKWIVAPPVLGALWFVFAVKVVIPFASGGHRYNPTTMFKYLGQTPQEIALNALSHPGLVVDYLLSEQNLTYLILLVQPIGWFLPAFSAASLMAFPDLAINMISDNAALKTIPWHYNVITGCFLFIGTIVSIEKLSDWLRRRWGGQPALVIAAVLLMLSLGHWFLWFNPQHYRALPHHEVLLRAIAAIPPDKSAITPLRLQAPFATREHYNNIGCFLNYPDFAGQFEYVLLDANERRYAPIVTQEFFDRFHRNPKYRLIFAEQNVFVFQRLGGESDWNIPVP